MNVNRSQFLGRLLMALPAVTDVAEEDGTDCFFFKNGKILTFNEELFCRVNSGLDEHVNGAVSHKRIIPFLQKLTNDTLVVLKKKGKLIIKAGKHRLAKFPLERAADIEQAVEIPKKWKRLPETFGEAVSLVSSCADAKSQFFFLTCIRMTRKFFEATDNDQVIRYPIKMPIEGSFLLPKKAILKLLAFEPSRFAETENWLFFKNGAGVLFGIHKFADNEFPNVSQSLDFTGDKLALNTGISTAAQLGGIFSKDDSDEHVHVTLSKGNIKIVGESVGGYYRENVPIKYKGKKAISFTIAPELLQDVVKRTSSVVVAPDKMRVQNPKYVYVVCLCAPKKNKEE